MEANNEFKDFNIAEALQFAPEGLKLYSPIFGEARFKKIDDDICIQVKDKYDNLRWFYEYGTFFPSDNDNYPEGECLLFPSVNHRCWNHWQNTLFLESIGSVCVDTITGNKFILDHNGTFFSDGTGSQYSTLIDCEDSSNYLLNSRYATPEEAKEFFEELDENGYKWNGKMVVEKEDKQKFYVGDDVYKWDGEDLKKEQNKPKFKVGDLIRNKQTGLCITIAEVKDDCYYSKAKTCLLFKYQDNWELVYPQNELSLEDRCTRLENALEICKKRLNIQVEILEGLEHKTKLLDCIDINERIDGLCKKFSEIRKLSKDTKNRLDSLESKMIILDSHNINDRLDALERRVTALELQTIRTTPPLTKDPYLNPNKVTCDDAECCKGKSASDVFKTPDKAGDNVTLEDMKNV